MLAADQRTCDCFERTLKAPDLDILLSFAEIAKDDPNYPVRVEALFHKYGMTEPQFNTNMTRIRGEARDCLSHG